MQDTMHLNHGDVTPNIKIQAYVESDSEESENPRHPSSQDNEIFQYSDSVSDADNRRSSHGPIWNVRDANSTSSSRESASVNSSRHIDRRQHSTNPKIDSPRSPHNTTTRQLPLRAGSSFSSQQPEYQSTQTFSSQTPPNPTRKRHTISDSQTPRDQLQQPQPQQYRPSSSQSPASHSRPRDEGAHHRSVARSGTNVLTENVGAAGFLEALEGYSLT